LPFSSCGGEGFFIDMHGFGVEKMLRNRKMMTLALCGTLLLGAIEVYAESAAIGKLEAVSGLTVSTSCDTCHTSAPSLNAFGVDFFSAGGTRGNGYQLSAGNWAALSTKDSDGDGTDNTTEIANGTNPGGTGAGSSNETATVGGCMTTSTTPWLMFLALWMVGLMVKRPQVK